MIAGLVARWRWPDPWGPVAALVAAGVFLLRGYDAALSRDSSVYAYAGQLVADGSVPYVDMLNRAGPLAQLVPGAGAAIGRAVGADDLLAMRVTMTVLSALAVWAAYALGRDLLGARAAGALTAATLLCFQGFVVYATAGPREKTTMVLLVLLALAALARRRWVLAGVAAALATLTWQGSLVPVLAVALVAALGVPGRRATVVALLRFGVSGLAVAGLTVLGFLAVGALPELYEGFYDVNARYSSADGLLYADAGALKQLTNGFGWSLWLLAAGLAASVLVSVLSLRRLDRDNPGRVALVALGPGALVAVGWTLFAFEGWPDALLFTPFAACGASAAAYLLLPRRRLPRLSAATAGVLALGALAATTVTAAAADPPRLEVQQHGVDVVVGSLEDPEVVAIGNPTPLVLAGLRNPVRYPLVEGPPRRYLEATYPGGLFGYGRDIAALDPTVITVRGLPPDWLRPTLTGSYARVGGGRQPYSWWVSRTETTPEERAAIRRGLAATPAAPDVADVQRSVP